MKYEESGGKKEEDENPDKNALWLLRSGFC